MKGRGPESDYLSRPTWTADLTLTRCLPACWTDELEAAALLDIGKLSALTTHCKEIRWISVPLPAGAPADETVWISVPKLDASWKKNLAQYIGPGGSGYRSVTVTKSSALGSNAEKLSGSHGSGSRTGKSLSRTGGTATPGCAIMARELCPSMSILPSPNRCNNVSEQRNASLYENLQAMRTGRKRSARSEQG